MPIPSKTLHGDEEILAVLAHETGHLIRHHTGKLFILLCMFSLPVSYGASKMIAWKIMYHVFGFSEMVTYAGLFLVTVLWGPLCFFLAPAALAILRSFEKEADSHALNIMGSPPPQTMHCGKWRPTTLQTFVPIPYMSFSNTLILR